MKNRVIASVNHACKVVGGQRALGRILGISSAAVYQWAAGLRDVPVRHCQAIVELTEGRVSVRDLRPNDWHLVWPPPKEITAEPFHPIEYDPNEGNLS